MNRRTRRAASTPRNEEYMDPLMRELVEEQMRSISNTRRERRVENNRQPVRSQRTQRVNIHPPDPQDVRERNKIIHELRNISERIRMMQTGLNTIIPRLRRGTDRTRQIARKELNSLNNRLLETFNQLQTLSRSYNFPPSLSHDVQELRRAITNTLDGIRHQTDEEIVIRGGSRREINNDNDNININQEVRELDERVNEAIEELSDYTTEDNISFSPIYERRNRDVRMRSIINTIIEGADNLCDPLHLIYRPWGDDEVLHNPTPDNIERMRLKRLLEEVVSITPCWNIVKRFSIAEDPRTEANFMRELLVRLLYILPHIPIQTDRSHFCFRIQTNQRWLYWYLTPDNALKVLKAVIFYINRMGEDFDNDPQNDGLVIGSDPVEVLIHQMPIIRQIQFSTLDVPPNDRVFKVHQSLATPSLVLNGERITKSIISTANRTRLRRIRQQLQLERESRIREISRTRVADERVERIINRQNNNNRNVALNGGFFPFFNNTEFDLRRYQIVHNEKELMDEHKIYKDNCFIYALRMSGKLDPSTIDDIAVFLKNRVVPLSKVSNVCKKFKILIRIYLPSGSIDRNFKSKIYGDKNSTIAIDLGCISKHYFLIEKIPVTNLYMKCRKDEGIMDRLRKACSRSKEEFLPGMRCQQQWRLKSINPIRQWNFNLERNSSRFISSLNLIYALVKDYQEQGTDEFRPIMFGDIIDLHLRLYRDLDRTKLDERLDYNPDICLKLMKSSDKTREETKPLIFYADFECCVCDENKRPLDRHIPFMCCLGGDLMDGVKTFIGEDAGRKVLDYICVNFSSLIQNRVVKRKGGEKEEKKEERKIIIYFHNLGYDLNFIAKYGIKSSMPRGRQVLQSQIRYNNVQFILKDSLALLPMKLSGIATSFKLPIEKEIFPYEYYTPSILSQSTYHPLGDVEDAVKCQNWDDRTKEGFLIALNKSRALRQGGKKFDLYQYASYYCVRDVEVLKEGLNRFRQEILRYFNLDCHDFVSICSLVHEYICQTVYYPPKDIFMLGGHVRQYIYKAVHGGRVMCRDNMMHHVEGEDLVDFDAVSLYPSAMARLETISGAPIPLKPEECTLEFLQRPEITAYVVDIIIYKVNRHLSFPLVIHKDPKTKKITNTNEGMISMTVCDIELEDLIRFQDIEFSICRGYYWTGQKNTKIQEVIRGIFNERVKLKKEDNPCQVVYKLIMNSIYGKTILKPIEHQLKFFNKDSSKYRIWLSNHTDYIERVDEVFDSNIVCVRTIKPIDEHYTYTLMGVRILAMSKRIMNEVMCLAEELGLHIYYQDTDSMHIAKRDIEILSREYQKRYHRELCGEKLGQFHPDFDKIKNDSTDIIADESYFIAKKCYIDRLRDAQGNTGFHIRMKGINKGCIDLMVNEEYEEDPLKLYDDLYHNKEITFDLAKGNVVFDVTKNFTVKSKESFLRKVKFNNPKAEGEM